MYLEKAAYEHSRGGDIAGDRNTVRISYRKVGRTPRRYRRGAGSIYLTLTQGKTPEEQARAKTQIDSIYTLIKGGADFSDLARRESEDPGSAKNGGMLPWFGAGRMVPEFEKAAFALADSAVSEPFQTSYGYHIVKTLGHRGVPALDDVRQQNYGYDAARRTRSASYRKKMDELRARFQTSPSDSLSENELIDLETERLAAEDTDFANLLREYHDGMLLFEISNRKIWGRRGKGYRGYREILRGPSWRLFSGRTQIQGFMSLYSQRLYDDGSQEYWLLPATSIPIR